MLTQLEIGRIIVFTVLKQPKGATMAAKAKRIKLDAFRNAGKKRDLSPSWTDYEKWTADQFTKHFREAMSYYNQNFGSKDLKPKIINWMSQNGYSAKEVKAFANTEDWRCGTTMGAVAANLLKGMPAKFKGFNNEHNSEEWLRKQISQVTAAGAHDAVEAVETKSKAAVYVPSVQDRLRDQAIKVTDELEAAIDSWMTDPEQFDPKAFKMISFFKGKNVKGVHARIIKGFYEDQLNEFLELASGTADEQLREGYQRYSRKNIRKMIEFLTDIRNACEQLSAESKVLRAPRKKKVKPAEEVVKKLKFKVSDDKLGIASVPAAGIIGAQMVVVYNTKKRKLGFYHSLNSDGLNVKGAKIINFTEKSFQKTLRKPAEKIKEFMGVTKAQTKKFMSNIKAVDIKLNGRLSADILILKVFK